MFNKIIGHKKQKSILENQLKHDQLSHAYIFTGPTGIGKRTLAESLAQEIILSGLDNKNRKVSLEHADIYRMGQDDQLITIKEIRDLISQMDNKPLEGESRVFIMDHADKMNPIAQNALLKTIEEPIQGNVFLLITDNPTALLPTILSRCQEIPFHDLTYNEKIEFLRSKGIENFPEDLSQTPGMLLQEVQDPEYFQKFNNYFNRFNQILAGEEIGIFDLAQDLSEDKAESIEALEYFIRKLSQKALKNEKPDRIILKTIDILFELLEKLSYNVNLRLQWESSIIQIIMEFSQ